MKGRVCLEWIFQRRTSYRIRNEEANKDSANTTLRQTLRFRTFSTHAVARFSVSGICSSSWRSLETDKCDNENYVATFEDPRALALGVGSGFKAESEIPRGCRAFPRRLQPVSCDAPKWHFQEVKFTKANEARTARRFGSFLFLCKEWHARRGCTRAHPNEITGEDARNVS